MISNDLVVDSLIFKNSSQAPFMLQKKKVILNLNNETVGVNIPVAKNTSPNIRTVMFLLFKQNTFAQEEGVGFVKGLQQLGEVPFVFVAESSVGVNVGVPRIQGIASFNNPLGADLSGVGFTIWKPGDYIYVNFSSGNFTGMESELAIIYIEDG